MAYISSSRLRSHIREFITDVAIRFESTMRMNPGGGDVWNCTEEYYAVVEFKMNQFVDILAQLTLERSKQRCKSSNEVKIIEQDVLDAFDVYKVTLQNRMQK